MEALESASVEAAADRYVALELIALLEQLLCVQFAGFPGEDAGRAQGLAVEIGRGRAVILGEAGMLSAQLIREPERADVRFGMNVAGNDNRRFALNLLHWLSRAP